MTDRRPEFVDALAATDRAILSAVEQAIGTLTMPEMTQLIVAMMERNVEDAVQAAIAPVSAPPDASNTMAAGLILDAMDRVYTPFIDALKRQAGREPVVSLAETG